MNKKIKPKYYMIAGNSILELLDSINKNNVWSINTYRRTTCIHQVVEPITAPGEYFAICYDVELPAKVNNTLRPNRDPLLEFIKETVVKIEEDLKPKKWTGGPR